MAGMTRIFIGKGLIYGEKDFIVNIHPQNVLTATSEDIYIDIDSSNLCDGIEVKVEIQKKNSIQQKEEHRS